MLDSPNRLIVDLRNDAPPNRNIAWYPGVRWREQTISLGGRQFPVTWLAINLRQVGLRLQPIWGNGNNSLVGTQSLAQLSQTWQAAAAINAGFFNRDRQLPLGAIRRDGQWVSGPILNRGVIAWNNTGEFRVGRLSLQQIVTTSTGQRFSLTDLNSGYVQSGVARYTRDWGQTYSPLSSQETIVTVVNNQVTNNQQSGASIFIPDNGYLLVFRRVEAGALSVGSTVQLQTQAIPAGLDNFANMIGAGPLLIESGQIVLNATAEQFGKGLDAQLAPRSAIAQTADGTVFLATTHNRVGGAGPSLPEWAQLLRSMGAVSALNLDGGSSTSLYLGGQLIDRHPVTATRIHNAIGLFVQPLP
jgi:exopolysaccharide biosynthesis protein